MKTNIYRDHFGGTISEIDVDKIVKISGWVENIRDHGGVVFIDVRDSKGLVQAVSNDDSILSSLTKESTVCITGLVRKRKEEDYNEKMATGHIEILISELKILGKSLNTLPFEIITSHEVSEDVRLKYRYLDLRNSKVRNNIVFRSELIKSLREKMEKLGHLEVQTPILTASSPEGARDFIVPSRKFHGKFYALPQAPQIFKQLLMISGFDKYFQIAPCFRDEDARADRIYGEFYQLDLEMAFATEEDVLEVGEEIFYDTFTKFSKKEVSTRPFVRLSYNESMNKYGTDKPDLRNPLEIVDVSNVFIDSEFKPFRNNVVKAIKVDNLSSKPNSWFNDMVDYATTIGMPGLGYLKVLENNTFAGPIDKFLNEKQSKLLIDLTNAKENSVIFFISDKKNVYRMSSLIRIELGNRLDLIDNNKFAFCIVKDFPMYEWSEELDKYDFTHNPFSMPKGGLDDLSNKNPEDILAYQFDFVCNGIEMASGAVRNHDLDIMKKVFEIAGYNEDEIKNRFKSLYSAFQYGPPPHAGMAPGIDRMIMLLLEKENIRETIAFPMTANGQDLMMGSPSDVTEQQLREVHIKARD